MIQRPSERNVKVITPRRRFYKVFDEAQIHKLISEVEFHQEIPREFNYFDIGASNWDKYAHRLEQEIQPNMLNQTILLLNANKGYLDMLSSARTNVRIVDIGPGNALPVKKLIAHLLARNKLVHYLAIDISQEMLKIVERNIKEWFGSKVVSQTLNIDIGDDRFPEIFSKEGSRNIDIFLALGGTFSNFRRPDDAYRAIRKCMDHDDLLVHTQKLDTAGSRRYFDFGHDSDRPGLSPNHRHVLDLLNVCEDFYEVEMDHDDTTHQRHIMISFKRPIKIRFEFARKIHEVDITKGQKILLWRSWQQSLRDVLNRLENNDFYPLQVSQTSDQEYILTVSRVKCD
jgi:uncharacterized SAM-dependent methyltransferase